jgi:hypothetical protein
VNPDNRPDNREDIREFLATRRARLTPADVGLPAGSRRRVGLAAVLAEVAEQTDADRRRLFSLEPDVQAFRRVVGTAPPR